MSVVDISRNNIQPANNMVNLKQAYLYNHVRNHKSSARFQKLIVPRVEAVSRSKQMKGITM